MVWTSPTGYEDPDSVWTTETYAYDEDVDTYSQGIAEEGWGNYLILTVSSQITSDSIRFNAWKHDFIALIDVDVYNSATETWVDVYEGTWSDHVWETKTFSNIFTTKARIRFASGSGYGSRLARVYEFDFNQLTVHTLTITETLGIVETPSTVYKGKKLVVDILGLLDTRTHNWTTSLSVSETMGILDTVTRSSTQQVTISDLIGLIDFTTENWYLTKLQVDRAFYDVARWNYFRWNVQQSYFDYAVVSASNKQSSTITNIITQIENNTLPPISLFLTKVESETKPSFTQIITTLESDVQPSFTQAITAAENIKSTSYGNAISSLEKSN